MNKDHEKLMQSKIYNELNDEELIRFNQLLSNNGKFRKEFEIFSEILNNLKDEKAMDLRIKLNMIYEEMYASKKETKMIKLIKENWFSVAAGIALLAMIGAFWFGSLNRQDWNDSIYENYYEEDEVFVKTRSVAIFNVDVLHLGMEFLEKKDFSAALLEFNKLPNSISANYYAGIANMELNNHQLAVIKFDFVIKDYLNLFYDQAQWYKALCLVKLEKKNEAIILFDEITQTESYFKDKAKQIVADLRKD